MNKILSIKKGSLTIYAKGNLNLSS